MRSITQKLSALAIAVLLANCALPSDEGAQSTNAADTAVKGDSREGLTHIRDFTKRARISATGDAVADAIQYVSSMAEGVGAKDSSFKVLSVSEHDAMDGLTHVRLQQTYQGLPVWGADSVVHLNGDTVVGAAGTVATKLAGTSTRIALAADDVIARAKKDRFGDKSVVTEREAVERVVHVSDDGTPRVALHTKFFNELQDDVQPAFWNHIFDANTGDVLAMWNELMTTAEDDGPQASGPSGNPRTVHVWNHELDVAQPAGSTNYAMNTSRLHTVNLNNGVSTAAEVTSPTLDTIGDAPINDAHGYAEVALDMMRDWQNRQSIDDHGYVIYSRVHYSRNYENAFWDGQQMTYGDGASLFYPLSGGLDVCAHEINHGYTSHHSNLAYSGQPGGLNEGFSDIAGKTAEFYYKDNPTFDLGSDVFKQPGKALRYMCNPPADGKSIDNVSHWTASLDPHYASGIPNKVFCVATKRFSAGGDPNGAATKDGAKRVSQAFYLANGQYWTSSTSYAQACQGMMDAARSMTYTDNELAMIKASWADVGVTCN
jgi:Zn-dependent metalloprotease